jgi:hypothetical protein
MTPRTRVWARAAVVLSWLGPWACSEPPPVNSPDPCAVLGTECPYCTQPAAVQTCQNAVATGDDVQCTVALDDSQVIADCVVPDGGGDATLDGDASLPACDPTVTSDDAGCACAEPCATTCPGGHCQITCPAGATCAPTCDGGYCDIVCLDGATCEASCAGGNCVLDCKAGSTCASSCSGGYCSFQCEDGAVCNDTCATNQTCTGP